MRIPLIAVALALFPAVSLGEIAAVAPPAPNPSTLGETTVPAKVQPTVAPSAQKVYDEKYVWVDDVPVTYIHNHVLQTTIWSSFYLGKDRKPIAGAELYDAIGRADLAATYRSRMAGKYLLWGVGAAAVVGGIVYGSTAPSPDVNSNQFAQQMNTQASAQITGLLVTAGGGALFIIGCFINPDPRDASEVRRIVEEYDQGLKRQLGSSAADPDEGLPKADRPGFSFGIAPGQGGAMASVAIAF